MRGLRAVSAAHCHHKSRDLAPAFQARLCQCTRDNVGQQGIAGDNHVRARHQYRKQRTRPRQEEFFYCTNVVGGKNCKSGKRRTFCAVKRRWDSPDSASPCAQLPLLFFRVLEQAVRRICDYRMDTELFSLREPLEAVPMHQGSIAEAMLLHRMLPLGKSSALRDGKELPQRVLGAIHSRKQCFGVESQIRTYGGVRGWSKYRLNAALYLGHRNALRMSRKDLYDRIAHFTGSLFGWH